MAVGQRKWKQDGIDQVQFEELCRIQCTRDEICSVLRVTDKTLNEWCNTTYGADFSVVFAQKRKDGKASLRRMQWKLAEKNATMGIWLGKQYLDQKDQIETNIPQLTRVDELLKELKDNATDN